MKANVNFDKIPVALEIASELGLTGDNEDNVVANAWKRLDDSDKRFISGMVKGMLIGMAEMPIDTKRDRSHTG